MWVLIPIAVWLIIAFALMYGVSQVFYYTQAQKYLWPNVKSEWLIYNEYWAYTRINETWVLFQPVKKENFFSATGKSRKEAEIKVREKVKKYLEEKDNN